MSRVLVLGSRGMAGHVLARVLRENPEIEVIGARRDHPDEALRFDAQELPTVERLINTIQPNVVVNCVGMLVKASNENPRSALLVNALLPHSLHELSRKCGFAFIHISTDCVFSGRDGPYIETDEADGLDVYAKSKWLGEIATGGSLTVRTSIIGPEISDHATGLFEWILQQSGEVNGFTRAFWSGVTTLELARAIAAWIVGPRPSGLVHFTNGEPISKYNLLRLICSIWEKNDVSIVPVPMPALNKTIISTRSDTHWSVPSYEQMLRDLRSFLKAKDV